MAGEHKNGARVRAGTLVVLALAVAGALVGTSATQAQKKPPTTCTLVPQLRDVTVNQGVGAYTPLVNGKETLVRFFLSMPACAGSGASIQITGGTLTVSGGGTVQAPTPVPSPTAYPVLASSTAAPMADSTGDPKFVVPASMVSRTAAFTASFSTTLSYRSRATTSATYSAIQPITFTTRPGTTTPITASFDRPSNALGILFVPMGDATRTYSSQWTTAGQQALQDGITAAVARQYPLPAGIGNLGGTAGLRYMVTPTLLDLKVLNLLNAQGKFCGTGANYDVIKGQLAQFLLSHNTVNPTAKANRVVGVVDPAVGLGPPNPCFEGMAVVNSQEAWALATPGRAGMLIGLELAHTLGLTPPSRESPFDGAHSQNIPAENPSLNRRYNLVQRSFLTADRSLLKPSGTNPSPDNINTLLEVPDFAFLLCVLGGTIIPECQQYGPGTVSASGPVAAGLTFVMSGTTTGGAGLSSPTGVGTAQGTSVVESYFASSVHQTAPSTGSIYRLVQRASTTGSVLSDQGVPVSFLHSEHGSESQSVPHSSGLFSLALPFLTNTNRIELWKGAPGASGSLLLYATDRTQAPVLQSFDVGSGIGYRPSGSARTNAPAVVQAIETLRGEAGTPAAPTSISSGSPLNAPISFGNSFSTVSQVCLNFHFIGDLLDPGENLSTSWGIGFGNGTATPQRDRTLCSMQPGETNRLLDGNEPLTISMDPGGSVTLGALVVSVTGDSINPVGYRISSGLPSYTVAQGGSVAVATTLTEDPASDAPAVDLTFRNLVPAGSFSTTPTAGTPTFTSDGTLSTSPSTGLGVYPLVVTAKGGGFTRSYDVTVTVVAPTAGLDVNSANNVDDGACNTTHCSLREAINASNASAGTPDTITFSIGTGPQTISPTSALPTITDPVTIDATTQEGFAGTPIIELDGSSVDGSAHGLNVTAGSTTIKGFVIDDFGLDGIHLENGGGNTVVGNWIGTDQSGQEPSPNLGDGIQMERSDGNQIGGTTAAERNVVSASRGHGIFMFESDGNSVEGNYVGTDVDGVSDFGNGIDGIAIDGGSNNDIGPGNISSGNTNQGVAIFTVGSSLQSSGNAILGNTFGLGSSGAPLPNGGQGVLIASGVGNSISQNSISANIGRGIVLGEGANGGLNAPTLDSAALEGATTTVEGSLTGVPDGDYIVEFFSNDACDPSEEGEGENFLDFAAVSAPDGAASFSKSLSGLAVDDVVTATLTGASTNNTSEFSNCVVVEEGEVLPPGQESYQATATDDNPGDNTMDLYLACPGQPTKVIAVGLKPDNVTASSATWFGNHDASLTPQGCELEAVVMDGFTRSNERSEPVDDGPANTLVAAISSPRENATFLQYGLIPLRGSIRNADGELAGSALQWTLTGPGISRSGTGAIVDQQPPQNGGWPDGTYTATLTTSGGGTSGTDTLTFTVKTDADNDGIPKAVEDSCLGAGGDSDPLNADDDKDLDGLPNVNDPQPCVPASSYTAIIEFDPDPFPTPSSGNTVTVSVRVPGRNVGQVLSGSVRITRIADEDVSANPNFRNIAWTVSGGVGTAKFDRQKLIQYLAARHIHNRFITVTVAGNSGAPVWSFEGSDTVFVQG